MPTTRTPGPRFKKIPFNGSRPMNSHCVDYINKYWGLTVAHVGNDNVIRSDEHLKNGVPAIANDPNFAYRHNDIVWVRWDGKNLKLAKREM